MNKLASLLTLRYKSAVINNIGVLIDWVGECTGREGRSREGVESRRR